MTLKRNYTVQQSQSWLTGNQTTRRYSKSKVGKSTWPGLTEAPVPNSDEDRVIGIATTPSNRVQFKRHQKRIEMKHGYLSTPGATAIFIISTNTVMQNVSRFRNSALHPLCPKTAKRRPYKIVHEQHLLFDWAHGLPSNVTFTAFLHQFPAHKQCLFSVRALNWEISGHPDAQLECITSIQARVTSPCTQTCDTGFGVRKTSHKWIACNAINKDGREPGLAGWRALTPFTAPICRYSQAR